MSVDISPQIFEEIFEKKMFNQYIAVYYSTFGYLLTLWITC